MFGPGDALFGRFAELARLLPVLPLIGGGRTRLQPVFVEDVAEAIAKQILPTLEPSAELNQLRRSLGKQRCASWSR